MSRCEGRRWKKTALLHVVFVCESVVEVDIGQLRHV